MIDITKYPVPAKPGSQIMVGEKNNLLNDKKQNNTDRVQELCYGWLKTQDQILLILPEKQAKQSMEQQKTTTITCYKLSNMQIMTKQKIKT